MEYKPAYGGGEVYTQTEVRKDPGLKTALDSTIPENVVIIRNNEYWVIEAKADLRDIKKAVTEGKGYAKKINDTAGLSCKIVTGVAGSPDHVHYIETHCLVGNRWKQLVLNGRKSTGFLTPEQVCEILEGGDGSLQDYQIEETLFINKTQQINEILHGGGINKRNRASVLACLLLALATKNPIPPSSNTTILIQDINSRARATLKKYDKESFFGEISIKLPTSTDNHVKHRKALVKSIEILQVLNIASTINSGRDVLGQFYEQFLKYANDAKELGIVLTPRHITNFAADIVQVSPHDIVYDPACGTGGFLVAALDRVRKTGHDMDAFKKGNLYGIEQDQLIATLAIVNMIFRGDGSSNIREGDCFSQPISTKPTKVLMNPPFAMDEEEWRFADLMLSHMKDGGLLFAVLPTTTVGSANDARSEITWRRQMLLRHTLMAVIKLPEQLFYPLVSKGTVGVVIKAGRPHNLQEDNVLWAIMHDGKRYTKTAKKDNRKNIEVISKGAGNMIATGTIPEPIPGQVTCSPIGDKGGDCCDLSPERYISSDRTSIDIPGVVKSIAAARRRMKRTATTPFSQVSRWGMFLLLDFVKHVERGKSGRAVELQSGDLPLISTSEKDNGICDTVSRSSVKKIYPPKRITISANGGSCRAFWHDYEFAVNADVFVLTMKKDYQDAKFGYYLCAAISNESWRYNYYRKFSTQRLNELEIQMPVDDNGNVDLKLVRRLVERSTE